MKNIRQDSDDWLRPEYSRSDFGEMVVGKYADAHVALPELVRLFLACIGEDAGLEFIFRSSGSHLAGHSQGDWTYEFDDAHQITLRYWIGKCGNIEESISTPPRITTAQEKSDLYNLLLKHVQALRTKVESL